MRDLLLVAPDDRLAGSRLARVLHRAGCRITLLGNSAGKIARSRFVAARLDCPRDAAGIAARLQSHLRRQRHKPHVILADESALAAAVLGRGESWLDPWFPVDHRGPALDVCLYKNTFIVAAEAAGIRVPVSHVCQNVAAGQGAAEKLGFPLVLKGRMGAGGGVVRLVNAAADFNDLFHELSQDTQTPVVVQQFITGRLGATELLFNRGQLVCWSSCYSLQCWPTPLSPSCVRQPMNHPEIEPAARAIGRLTGFHGLCGMDWIHDPMRDKLHIIEFNARPTPGYHLGHHSGVDFSVALKSMFAGRPIPQRPRVSPGAKPVFMFPHHLNRCLADRGIVGLRHWLPGAALHDIPWDDVGLFRLHTDAAQARLRSSLNRAGTKFASRFRGFTRPLPMGEFYSSRV